MRRKDKNEFPERKRGRKADTVLKLYRSLLGTPHCVVDRRLSFRKEVEFDPSRDALFLVCGRCRKYRRWDLHWWWSKMWNGCMLVRNNGAVSGGLPGGEYAGNSRTRGIARKLFEGAMMEELKKRGYRAVHLLFCEGQCKKHSALMISWILRMESGNLGIYVLGVMRKEL